MSAKAEAIVVKCPDPRIQKTIRVFLETQELPEGTFFPLTPLGGSLNIIKVEEGIQLAIEELGARQIFIFGHRKCKANEKKYGMDDLARHLENLHAAESWVTNRFPELQVRLFLMHWISDEVWQIEEIKG